jgi:hypothetical protein
VVAKTERSVQVTHNNPDREDEEGSWMWDSLLLTSILDAL